MRRAAADRDGVRAPRLHFFGGKGGVGKTTCAAAWATERARRGERVLVVSTDPAHSLGDALGVRLGPEPRRVRARLEAIELDADRALARWLRVHRSEMSTLLLRGTWLDEKDVDRFLGLSLPGVDELMGLRELLLLVRRGAHDEIVVDTAPTGHTLRLLETPDSLRRIATILDDLQEKHRVLSRSLGGRVVFDSAEALIQDLSDEAAELHALLRDPARSRFTWILLPEPLSVAETLDALAALHSSGLPTPHLLVNRITPAPRSPCPLCTPRHSAEQSLLSRLPFPFRVVPEVPGVPGDTLRLVTLGSAWVPGTKRPDTVPLGRAGRWTNRSRTAAKSMTYRSKSVPGSTGSTGSIVPDGARLLLFGGKGGVGKTTCAAAVAVELAGRRGGKRVLLLSTDPAHSLGDVLGMEIGDEEREVPGVPGLRARELDAAVELARRKAAWGDAVDELFSVGQPGRGVRIDLSLDRRAAEDLIELTPPGLDEILAVLTIVDALASDHPRYELVIVDTAPTGHALRMLAMPSRAREWVRALIEILVKYDRLVDAARLGRELLALSRGLGRLDALLADRRRARFIAVTRAAELPMLETGRLLDRVDVALSAVIVNAVTSPECARCRAVAKQEARRIARLRERVTILAPAVAPPPRGVSALRTWARAWKRR